MDGPLRCYESELYYSISGSYTALRQCIAPTKAPARCRWGTGRDYTEAAGFRERIENLEHGNERNELLKKYILLRCCEEQHRWRLKTDRNCLDALIYRYGVDIPKLVPRPTPAPTQPAMLPTPPSMLSSLPESEPRQSFAVVPSLGSISTPQKSAPGSMLTPPQTVPTDTFAPPTSIPQNLPTPPPSASKAGSAPASSGFVTDPFTTPPSTTKANSLFVFAAPASVNVAKNPFTIASDNLFANPQSGPSKDASHTPEGLFADTVKPKPNEIQYDVFVAYPNPPGETVADLVRKPVPKSATVEGEVYCFARPSHPGFIKIGFTGRTSQIRLEEWKDCNPGAFLVKFAKFPWPDRFERLIHLEMANHRCMIVRCKNCGKAHHEWFSVSQDYVTQVINDWATIANHERLYDATGFLTEKWTTRLETVSGRITSRMLLELLNGTSNDPSAPRKQKEVAHESASLQSEPWSMASFEQFRAEIQQSIIARVKTNVVAQLETEVIPSIKEKIVTQVREEVFGAFRESVLAEIKVKVRAVFEGKNQASLLLEVLSALDDERAKIKEEPRESPVKGNTGKTDVKHRETVVMKQKAVEYLTEELAETADVEDKIPWNERQGTTRSDKVWGERVPLVVKQENKSIEVKEEIDEDSQEEGEEEEEIENERREEDVQDEYDDEDQYAHDEYDGSYEDEVSDDYDGEEQEEDEAE